MTAGLLGKAVALPTLAFDGHRTISMAKYGANVANFKALLRLLMLIALCLHYGPVRVNGDSCGVPDCEDQPDGSFFSDPTNCS